MPPESITRSDSFVLRAQRSEEQRTRVMIGVFALLLALLVLRRLLHGTVMSVSAVFWPTAALLVGVLVYEAFALRNIRRAIRESRRLPSWRWTLNAAVELAVPLGALLILHAFSPTGPVASLSAPVILTLPLLIMLSVLRLRPRFTLLIGASAAVFHLGLTAVTAMNAHTDSHMYPVLFTYSAILAVCAGAGALVSRAVAGYVREAAAEAAAREHTAAELRSIEHELSLARDVQRGLIPSQPPAIEGYQIAGMSRPADQTGGDYYDWQTLPDGRTAVVVADVTGHGIGPALVMAVCRAYSRASAPLVGGPSQLLSTLNRLIHDDVQGRRFITLAVAVLEPRSGRVELLSAGHGPSMLFRAASRSIESFGGDGVPLGVLPDETYGQPRILQMNPGDVLLLATDGFFEWQRPDGQQFGLSRLESSLRAAAGEANHAQIIDLIDRDVRAFAEGQPQGDDTTAVTIRRC